MDAKAVKDSGCPDSLGTPAKLDGLARPQCSHYFMWEDVLQPEITGRPLVRKHQCGANAMLFGSFCTLHEGFGTAARAAQACGQIDALIEAFEANVLPPETTPLELMESIKRSLLLFFRDDKDKPKWQKKP